MSKSIPQICSDTSEHLVDSLRTFLVDNKIILARDTMINMHEIQDIQQGNAISYKLLLETEVISIGWVEEILVPYDI